DRQTSAPDAAASAHAAQNLETAAMITLVSGGLLLGGGITWGLLQQKPARGGEARHEAELRLGPRGVSLKTLF
ncbi:MAG TPA: hypothetical protein VJU61_24925, partial [Polyangiaceae bacterium]|nr:hypothetical protein [Polyangiaceae bacterium]